MCHRNISAAVIRSMASYVNVQTGDSEASDSNTSGMNVTDNNLKVECLIIAAYK